VRMMTQLLTVREVAHQLHVSERHVRMLISTGALRIIRLRRSVRISPEAIAQLLRESEAPRLAS